MKNLKDQKSGCEYNKSLKCLFKKWLKKIIQIKYIVSFTVNWRKSYIYIKQNFIVKKFYMLYYVEYIHKF